MLYYEYEIPKDRTPDSFAFKVEEIWAGRAVDEYWTDDRSDVNSIVEHRDSSLYDVRVTPANGAIEYYVPAHYANRDPE